MTTRPKRTAAFALCGSFCSFSAVMVSPVGTRVARQA